MMSDRFAKIVSREQVIAARKAARAEGKKVGFTSGVFDLLHPGHVDYLIRARAMCDLLFVGVNSNASVKQYKGEERPICDERDRAAVVSALGCVDLAFIFGERNNNLNVELLEPDLYIKAGDYDRGKLSSAAAVEARGGRVAIIPALDSYSSTRIIERCAKVYGEEDHSIASMAGARPCVFLDRDGTIIEHVHYLHEPGKMRILPGSLEGMKKLKEKGFRLVVITNQPGIGLGYFSREDFFRVNTRLLSATSKAGIYIDKIYYCPHNEADRCACRKPAPGMIERACRDLEIDMKRSYMIGDMAGDVLAGRQAGCKTILICGDDGLAAEVKPDMRATDLLDAATQILAKEGMQ